MRRMSDHMQVHLQAITLERTVIPTVAALAACGATACVMTGCTPYQLFSKGKQWLARRRVPPDASEPDGEPWPAAGFPGPPQCRPLSTIAELMTWQPPSAVSPTSNLVTTNQDHQHTPQPPAQQQQLAIDKPERPVDPCTSTVQLVTAHPSKIAAAHTQGAVSSAAGVLPGQRPQLLVCHDMMGGYLPQDALLSGADTHRHYRMWHWDCIDVFVYFSHHMVTIPPKGWIHAAHKHGVKVLGTFITEFGQGRRRCNKLFSSKQSAQRVADQLVAVAAHYGFEGWLVNIENSLSGNQVEVMKHFVGYLRARMAAAVEHSMVVWYDAVTTAGELRWQNKLSELNAPFFDLSDALFVNYNWTPETLSETVTAAAARHTEVYMGIDVHGRGSYGGGGHNVDVALQAAAAAGLSAALFAPGWVYENLDKSTFTESQEQWWSKVQASWGCSHPVIHSLPLDTSFNAGAGKAWFQDGQLVAQGSAAAAAAAAATCTGSAESKRQQQQGSTEVKDAASSADVDSGWFNMVLTDTLPTCRDPIAQQVVTGPVACRLSASTAYNGGSCLVLCSQHLLAKAPTADSQQELAQCEQALLHAAEASAATHADAAKTSCCSLQIVQPEATAATDTEQSNMQTMAMLQLFRTHVPVQDDRVLTVSWVYAAPKPGSSTDCYDDGAQQQQQATPVLWVMTEKYHTAAGTTAVGVQQQHRAIRMLSKLSAPFSKDSTPELQLQLPGGTDSGVAVQAAGPPTQLAGAGRSLGPVTFVCNSGGDSTSRGGNGASLETSSSSAAAGLDSMWDADLSGVLKDYEWWSCVAQLPVEAGSVVTGIGVAVGTGDVLGRTEAGVQVHGVLGQLSVA